LNINSAASIGTIYPLMPNKTNAVEISALNAAASGSSKKIDVEKSAIEVEVTPKKSEEIEHYKYEEKPWQADKWYMENLDYDDHRKAFYMAMQRLESESALYTIKREFKEFSDYIRDVRPDISSKEFGFTLDENAKIKILNGRKQLSDADELWLTEEINRLGKLKKTMHAHSKTLMTFVDHCESFGGKYNLNRYNFQSTVDYGEILNIQRGRLHDSFIKMVHSYVPRRSEPLINTYA